MDVRTARPRAMSIGRLSVTGHFARGLHLNNVVAPGGGREGVKFAWYGQVFRYDRRGERRLLRGLLFSWRGHGCGSQAPRRELGRLCVDVGGE